ncbi:MAG: hypothetical protein E4H40_03520 [Candidatus Brocadiia bacterium]|nr:MAG: hypothetical protein E4H40_03520 [Candidatus Brocadiia bacterium]
MEKVLLLNQLEHIKNNYIIGLAAYSVFTSERSYPLLNTHLAAFGDYTVTFDQLVKLLQNPYDRNIALNEFLKMLMRTLIKESFENIKDYCTMTKQYEIFKAEPWYEFARLIRNFLSHNCRFEFNKYDMDRLPVSWKGREITTEMDRQTIGMSFFGNVETWELFQEFYEFAQNRIR